MRRPLLLLLSTLLGVAACDDAGRATGPVMGNEPRHTISDGANRSGGPANGDFFFLPPMVRDPSGSLAFDAGAFDGTRDVRVEVCRLTVSLPRTCEAMVRTFSDAAVVVADEQYQVNWRTDLDGLLTDRLYRIAVTVPRPEHDGHEHRHTLGYADVDPVSSGRELKNVSTGEFIPLLDGRTLPIKFRIERSPRCESSEDCVEAIVSDAGGRIETESGHAVAEFEPGWLPPGFSEVVVAIRRVPIGGPGDDASCHGTTDRQYEGCYDFATFPAVGTFAKPAAVSTCIDEARLTEAELSVLQLYASDDGEDLRRLPPVQVEIECEGFLGTPRESGPIGVLERARMRALALAARLGVAVAPRELHAIDLGRGGLIDRFSHVGWILSGRAVLLDPSESPITGAPGSARTVAVRVVSDHDADPETGPELPLAGFAVNFSLSAGGGSLGAASAVTNADGVATTVWTLPAAGEHTLTATAAGSDDPVTIVATVLDDDPDFVMNFEVAANGEPIEHGDVVDDAYAAWGIHLRRVGNQSLCYTQSDHVFAGGHVVDGFGSAPNGVTVCPANIAPDFHENAFGRIHVDFSYEGPISRVCIDVGPTAEGGISFLEAYDAAGAVLDRSESDAGKTQRICVDDPEIRAVQFAGKGSLHATFDDLRIWF